MASMGSGGLKRTNSGKLWKEYCVDENTLMHLQEGIRINRSPTSAQQQGYITPRRFTCWSVAAAIQKKMGFYSPIF